MTRLAIALLFAGAAFAQSGWPDQSPFSFICRSSIAVQDGQNIDPNAPAPVAQPNYNPQPPAPGFPTPTPSTGKFCALKLAPSPVGYRVVLNLDGPNGGLHVPFQIDPGMDGIGFAEIATMRIQSIQIGFLTIPALHQ